MQFLRCLKFGFLTPCDRLIACSISPIRHGMIVICCYEGWIPLTDPGWDIIMKYISQWFFLVGKRIPGLFLSLFICHMSPSQILYISFYVIYHMPASLYTFYTIYHMPSHISYVICHIPYTCFSLYVICPHIIWHIPCYMTPKSNPTFLPKDRWNNLPLPNQLYEPRVSK